VGAGNEMGREGSKGRKGVGKGKAERGREGKGGK
jgi:hypothetical protein